jgi:hypothetical protein
LSFLHAPAAASASASANVVQILIIGVLPG